jgi:hypothetical protein
MRKKRENFGTTTPMNYLVSFLNEPSVIPPDDSKGLTIDDLRGSLTLVLTNLIAPKAMVVGTSRANRKMFDDTILNKFYRPERVLSQLVASLNAQRLQPQWKITKPSAVTAKIEVRGLRAAVIMNGFGGNSVKNRVWAAVAKLLESGEISKIGRCAICGRFYAKSRDWQKCCSRAECKRKYDNFLSADRKFRFRERERKKKQSRN